MISAQVIFLNGASSSGKTSLARALQRQLAPAFLTFAEDMFFSTLPDRAFDEAQGFRYGSRLYKGFTHCVRTMVECENRVIVDTVAWVPGCLAGFVNALWDMNVFAVGVHCPLDILEQREQQRKDRSIGLSRRQIEQVHRNAIYDLEVDTSVTQIDVCAAHIIRAMQTPASPHAFAQMKSRVDAGVME
jgi:chloramphenicol 3-O phosphotransferase